MSDNRKASSFSAAMSKTEEKPIEAPVAAPEPQVVSPPPEVPARPLTARKSKTRRTTRQVGGHFDPAVGKMLNLMAVEEDTTVQNLLAEAIDMLFQSRGKAMIATRQPNRATA